MPRRQGRPHLYSRDSRVSKVSSTGAVYGGPTQKIRKAHNYRRNSAIGTGYTAASGYESSYQYTPLANPNRQIRLLTIRAEKENDVELRCYLKTFESINDAPPYRALSYLWGKDDGEWKPKISLNKKNFEVGTNLHLALEHVGHMTFIGSPEWTGCWWIDAICIDQKNPHEKNEQIKIMKNIYENADEVVAWLGPPEERTVQAMRTISGFPKVDIEILAAACMDITKQPDIRDLVSAVRDIFDREYWSRVWILQELAVSRKRRLVCGKGELDWQQLVWFATVVAGADVLGKELCNVQMTMMRCQPVWLLSLIYEDPRWKADLNLAKLVYLSRFSNATETEDHIIALLGMLPYRAGDKWYVEGTACSVICRAVRQIVKTKTSEGSRERASCERIASECEHKPISLELRFQKLRKKCQGECGSLHTCRKIATLIYQHSILYSGPVTPGGKVVQYGLDRQWVD